jgi:hypothetical protein
MPARTLKPGARIDADDIRPYTHRPVIERTGNSAAMTRLLVTEAEPHRWALVQNQVGGWHCIAVGEAMPGWSVETLTEDITNRYGDGFARLPRDQHALTKPTSDDIHILRDPDTGRTTYCGGNAPSPYVYVRGRYMQHCLKCNTVYRAEHTGRCPVEA